MRSKRHRLKEMNRNREESEGKERKANLKKNYLGPKFIFYEMQGYEMQEGEGYLEYRKKQNKIK